MLEDSLILGFEDIISWQPGGKSFKVFDPDRFEKEIIKDYFNQTKYKSFQRQLNLYGFQRVQTGPNKGGYIHKLFSEGNVDQCDGMCRKHHMKILSTNNNERSRLTEIESPSLGNSTMDVNLLSNQMQFPSTAVEKSGANISEADTFYNFFFPDEQKDRDLTSPFLQEDVENGTSELRCLHDPFYNQRETLSSSFSSTSPSQVFSWSTSHEGIVNDSLQDINKITEDVSFNEFFSGLTSLSNDFGDICDDKPANEKETSFPWKLHLMLENAEKDNYQHIVSWVRNGTAFKVHNSKAFVELVLPNYFDQTKYESFRRQLNIYGFDRVSRGVDRGILSHTHFRQGARWLCTMVTSKSHESL